MRTLIRRWWFWTAVAVVVLVGGGSVAYATQYSDAARTKQLRTWLADAHEFDPKYENLGTVEYRDGDVTVTASHEWADPYYGGYFLCAWVEPWLRDLGHGDRHSQIIVTMGGEEILRSRGAAESCEDASYRAEYGS